MYGYPLSIGGIQLNQASNFLRLELAKCVANPSCAANVACLQTCNNRPDETECQVISGVSSVLEESTLHLGGNSFGSEQFRCPFFLFFAD